MLEIRYMESSEEMDLYGLPMSNKKNLICLFRYMEGKSICLTPIHMVMVVLQMFLKDNTISLVIWKFRTAPL